MADMCTVYMMILGEGFRGVLARIDHEYHKYDPDDTK